MVKASLVVDRLVEKASPVAADDSLMTVLDDVHVVLDDVQVVLCDVHVLAEGRLVECRPVDSEAGLVDGLGMKAQHGAAAD